MIKEKIKDQLEEFEMYLNDIPMILDPCRMCKNYTNENYSEACSVCCYFYGSCFELKKGDIKE